MRNISDIEFRVGEDTEPEDGDLILYRDSVEKLISSIILELNVEYDILLQDGVITQKAYEALLMTLELLEERKK